MCGLCRFSGLFGKPASDLAPDKIKAADAALARMEHSWRPRDPGRRGRVTRRRRVPAYTRVAHEGGFHLDGYASIRRWIGAAERALGLPAAR